MNQKMKLILAPPGAGKTHALVEQINDLLDSGVSPYRILATTFSREGARELSERLGGDVTVRTVHSLAWWVVRIARRARGERLPQILPPEEALSLIERAMKRTEAKFIEPVQVQTEMAAVREQGGSLDALHPSVQKVIRAYAQILAEEHKIDFTGILAAAQKELEDPELQAFLGGMHIFVDEGQDVSALTEWPVLEGFRHVSEQFVLMASPSQQIYGFKGASWTRLSAQFPEDTETSYLVNNYRSTPEIIEASRRLAGPDARHMRPVRPSLRQPVTLALCLDQGLEVEFIGKSVQFWHSAGIALPEIAILARAHALHYPIQDLLRACNLPYRVVGDRPDFYARLEIQATLGYLEIALDPTNTHALESILNYPPAGMGIRLRRRLRGDSAIAWKHLEEAARDPSSFPPQLVQRAGELLSFRTQSALIIDAIEPVPQKLERLVSLSGIPAYLEGEGDFQGLRALHDLVTSAVEYESLAKFRGHLVAEVERPRLTEGIQLATLHAAKGREWRAVLLPNFQDGIIPLRRMDPLEEQNLAFVGLTRARDHLAITLSRQGLPSPFLNEMPLERVQWP